MLGRGADGALIDAVHGEPVSDEGTRHAAIAGQYAHVTAPLRRLGDRFATEVCLAVTAGAPVPDWVTRALPTLPKALRSADSLSSSADRLSVDLAESIVLEDQVGQRFSAVATRAAGEKRPAEVYIDTPAVIAPCEGTPEPGHRLDVVLSAADPVKRQVRFSPVTNP
mgnify:FL=1